MYTATLQQAIVVNNLPSSTGNITYNTAKGQINEQLKKLIEG